MIPKKLHYCWFGAAPMGKQITNCIESWKHFCPDYEIVRWDESNAPLQDNLYIQQAYRLKKWAFVSDYVRLKAIWSQGGIYLDTDVELLKSLDSFLDHEAFMGFENNEKVATCIMGCQPKNSFIERAARQYEVNSFLLADGSWDNTTNVERVTALLEQFGLAKNNQLQRIGSVTIYPSDFFSPKNLETGKIEVTENSHTIHYFQASWMPAKNRIHTQIAQVLGPKYTQWVKRILGRV